MKKTIPKDSLLSPSSSWMVSLMVIILDASAQSRESRNDHHRSADDAETDTDYYSLGHYFFSLTSDIHFLRYLYSNIRETHLSHLMYNNSLSDNTLKNIVEIIHRKEYKTSYPTS